MKRRDDMNASRDDHRGSTRSKEELDRRRKEWMIEQEKIREHELRKRKMIQDYEERRARELASQKHKRGESHRSRSRSHSRGRTVRNRSRSRSKSSERSRKNDKHERSSSQHFVMSEKYDSMSTSTKLFKGGDGTKISPSELKSIKTIIRRNIPSTETTSQLDREIDNPEEIKPLRREGEGTKPIFEREELKKADKSSARVEEHRTVVSVDSPRASQSTRIRSASSSSPRRHRHSSPRDSRFKSREPERDDRYEGSKCDRDHYRDRSREYRESHHSSHKSSQSRSHEYRHRTPPREYDDRRYRSGERDHDRHDTRTRRDSRERDRRMPVPHHYMEPVPVPIFYDNYMRPIMVDPMVALRHPVSMMRGRMPPVMGAVRTPFPPRMVHPPIFRPGGPQHPRFGRM